MRIKNALVYTADGAFKQQDLCIENTLIAAACSDARVYDAEKLYAIPGLIDIHLHGAMGCDFCDADPQSLRTIARYEAQHGITAFVPASMTLPETALLKIFQTACNFKCTDGAMLLGLHMEGPFLSRERCGAQDPAYLCPVDRAMFRRLNQASGNQIRLVTLAPELPGALAFIDACCHETVIALGHTAASYACTARAFKAGASHVTHLYNAMSPFSHRETGLLGAAFDTAKVTAELIVDGIHSHPSAVRMAFRLFGPHRLCLVSDSMRATGLGDGLYTLGGQRVTVSGQTATLSDHTLAGSVTNLMDCLRLAVSFGIALEDALWSATVTPAKVIGAFDRLGSLEPGKLANIVLMDPGLNIHQVFLKGTPIL